MNANLRLQQCVRELMMKSTSQYSFPAPRPMRKLQVPVTPAVIVEDRITEIQVEYAGEIEEGYAWFTVRETSVPVENIATLAHDFTFAIFESDLDQPLMRQFEFYKNTFRWFYLKIFTFITFSQSSITLPFKRRKYKTHDKFL